MLLVGTSATVTFSSEISSGSFLAIANLLDQAETALQSAPIAISLVETSPWNFLVCVISTSVFGLWIYAGYLEFDKVFVKFSLLLWTFLLSVWLTVNSGGCSAPFAVLLGWEIVGLVSFLLIAT